MTTALNTPDTATNFEAEPPTPTPLQRVLLIFTAPAQAFRHFGLRCKLVAPVCADRSSQLRLRRCH